MQVGRRSASGRPATRSFSRRRDSGGTAAIAAGVSWNRRGLSTESTLRACCSTPARHRAAARCSCRRCPGTCSARAGAASARTVPARICHRRAAPGAGRCCRRARLAGGVSATLPAGSAQHVRVLVGTVAAAPRASTTERCNPEGDTDEHARQRHPGQGVVEEPLKGISDEGVEHETSLSVGGRDVGLYLEL